MSENEMLLERLLCAIFTVHKTIHTLFDLSFLHCSMALVHAIHLPFATDDNTFSAFAWLLI